MAVTKPTPRAKTERTLVTASDFQKEMMRLDGTAESCNFLIYGDSNVGKTWLSGTCPGRVLWLVCEPGYKSAARNGASGFARRVSDSATALAAVDWLNGNGKAGPHYQAFDWLVVDGLSTMQDRFRLAYTAEAFDSSPESHRSRAHRNLPDRPDYFNTQNFLKAWVPQLVDIPVNLLITAHAYRTDKTENGELLTFPGIQGKVTETANAIAGLMDVVGYYELKRLRNKAGQTKMVRRLYFESPPSEDIRYICGDKFNALGTHMDFPTIPNMMQLIDNGGSDADA